MELIYYVWGVMIHCMLHFRTGSDTPPCFQLLGCIPFTELRCIDLKCVTHPPTCCSMGVNIYIYIVFPYIMQLINQIVNQSCN